LFSSHSILRPRDFLLNRFPYYFIRLLVAATFLSPCCKDLLLPAEFFKVFMDDSRHILDTFSDGLKRRESADNCAEWKFRFFMSFHFSSPHHPSHKSTLREFLRKISHVNDAHVSPLLISLHSVFLYCSRASVLCRWNYFCWNYLRQVCVYSRENVEFSLCQNRCDDL
jgi:hypothetical protein